MEEAVVIMTGLNPLRVIESLPIVISMHKAAANKPLRIVVDYSTPDVSEKVLKIILSYTDFVKRRVWRIHE
jgi:UDP-N-acetylglucosamine 2-epimerase (non-hydrolysing)